MNFSAPVSRITAYRLKTKSPGSPRDYSRQRGTAVLVVLVIISILLIFIAGNLRTLDGLGNQVKLLEKKQELRLQRVVLTNAPATVPPPTTDSRK